MPSFIETHVHLDADAYKDDLSEVLLRARAAGISRFLTIGAGKGFASAHNAIALAAKNSDIWAATGIHPHDASTPLDVDLLTTLASEKRVIAIGETGLDFHYDFAPRAEQERWFIAQIEISKQLNKPLIIHSRNAGLEVLALLRKHEASTVGGVFHCFSENADFAAALAELNFLVSVGGVLTFKKAVAAKEAFAAIPLSQIMLETDGPYLAPEPYRGKRCESAHLAITAQTLADLKGISIDEVAEVTTANALKLFGF